MIKIHVGLNETKNACVNFHNSYDAVKRICGQTSDLSLCFNAFNPTLKAISSYNWSLANNFEILNLFC